MVLNEVFGFSYLDSVFSSIQAAIMRLHWSRVAAKPLYAPLVNTVSDRLGFENWDMNIYRFWRFCMRFSVLIESFFAVLRLWMIFATALRFLIDPLILPYSGGLHGFLLYKLKISLSKITDLLFRSVPCLRLQ